ncbi:phage anti-RecBCD protein [Salmonella enterica subsp. enterica serovar Infantis]
MWLAEQEEPERISPTSIRPVRTATYTKFIEIDPRLRNDRSLYGAISND